MKIGTRLLLGFTACQAFLLLLNGVAIYDMKGIARKSSQAIGVDAKLSDSAQRMRANINMLRRYEKDAFINIADPAKVDGYVKKWGEVSEHVKTRMDTLQKLEKDTKNLEVLAGIVKAHKEYEAGFAKVVAQIKAGAITTTQDANKAIEEYKGATHLAEKNVTGYAVANDESMAKIEKGVDDYVRHAITLSLAIDAVAFIVILVLSSYLIRSIKRPLNQVELLISDIAQGEGDLTKRLTYDGRDELGTICAKFNQFMEKLHSIISTVASTTSQVASAAVQLNSSSVQIATGAEQVAAQSGTVATAGEEMSATSGDIAQNCQMAAEGSKMASEAAVSGAQVVDETISVMNNIAERVKNSAKAVESLGSRSDQIGEIVGTIEDIADQTNLLALNAAIEAARAGEQGRGFAVVADEVRALAERTTRATREIGEMIKAIQSETKGAVIAMEEGVIEVGKGSDKAASSGRALENILDQINAVTEQIHHVATAAEEQTATTSEISSNMQQITEVVAQTAHGAHESATAANQLSGLAEELRRIVGQFRLA